MGIKHVYSSDQSHLALPRLDFYGWKTARQTHRTELTQTMGVLRWDESVDALPRCIIRFFEDDQLEYTNRRHTLPGRRIEVH